MKVCTSCKIEKTLNDFYNNKSTKDGKSRQCKDCKTATNEAWRKNNQAKVNQWNRKYTALRGKEWKRNVRLKSRYGITLETFKEMVEHQDGKCLICKSADYGRFDDLVVDHCHETGKIRGLLCDNCNKLLGHAFESIDTLQEAIKYLEAFYEI